MVGSYQEETQSPAAHDRAGLRLGRRAAWEVTSGLPLSPFPADSCWGFRAKGPPGRGRGGGGASWPGLSQSSGSHCPSPRGLVRPTGLAGMSGTLPHPPPALHLVLEEPGREWGVGAKVCGWNVGWGPYRLLCPQSPLSFVSTFTGVLLREGILRLTQLSTPDQL